MTSKISKACLPSISRWSIWFAVFPFSVFRWIRLNWNIVLNITFLSSLRSRWAFPICTNLIGYHSATVCRSDVHKVGFWRIIRPAYGSRMVAKRLCADRISSLSFKSSWRLNPSFLCMTSKSIMQSIKNWEKLWENYKQGFHFLLISANPQNQQICCLRTQQKSANQQKWVLWSNLILCR
jgi:hypothetical protein